MTSYLLLWGIGSAAGALAGDAVLRRRNALGWASAGAVGVAWAGLVIGARWHYRLETMPVLDALILPPRDVLDAGMRLPLGVFVGGIFAFVWSLLWQIPLAQIGDALAVSMAVTSAVGRIGCLVNDCCPGRVCPPWAAAWCPAPGPGSTAFAIQAGRGLIPPEASHALPVWPLPAFFIGTAAIILGILLWQLYRDYKPGSLLLAACVLGPIAKIALEQLRLESRPPGMMLGIPAITAGIALAVLALRARSVPRRNRLARA